MDQSRKAATAWLMVVAWAAVTFFMSANTGDDLSDPEGILGFIKQLIDEVQLALLGPSVDVTSSAAHFAEYAVLGVLLFRAVRLSGWKKPSSEAGDASSSAWFVFLAVAIASLYGVTDEIHQLFVPGRFCDPVDWMVDTAGALAGALIYLQWLRRKLRPKA